MALLLLCMMFKRIKTVKSWRRCVHRGEGDGECCEPRDIGGGGYVSSIIFLMLG